MILPTKSSKAAELRKLVFWALTQGQKPQYTAKLWFAPIPKVVLVASEKTLKQSSAADLTARQPVLGVAAGRAHGRPPAAVSRAMDDPWG